MLLSSYNIHLVNIFIYLNQSTHQLKYNSLTNLLAWFPVSAFTNQSADQKGVFRT